MQESNVPEAGMARARVVRLGLPADRLPRHRAPHRPLVRRRRRHAEKTSSPSSFGKTVRRFAKHALYALFALLLAHVLLSYFISLPRLYAMMQHAPGENWGSFVFVRPHWEHKKDGNKTHDLHVF